MQLLDKLSINLLPPFDCEHGRTRQHQQEYLLSLQASTPTSPAISLPTLSFFLLHNSLLPHHLLPSLQSSSTLYISDLSSPPLSFSIYWHHHSLMLIILFLNSVIVSLKFYCCKKKTLRLSLFRLTIHKYLQIFVSLLSLSRDAHHYLTPSPKRALKLSRSLSRWSSFQKPFFAKQFLYSHKMLFCFLKQ